MSNIPFPTTPCQAYTVHTTPFYESPNPKSAKIMDIPAWTVVRFEGITDKDGEIPWIFIQWTDPETFVSKAGWAPRAYFEQLTNEFSPGMISDHSSLIAWMVPGELCAAYVLGCDLDTVIQNYRAPKPPWWHWWLGKAYCTSPHDLANLFSKFHTDVKWLADLLLDPVIGWTVFTPQHVLASTKGFRPVVSVWIDQIEGRLCPQDALHRDGRPSWVVVVKITPDGLANGWVEVYNPIPNQIQRYSWQEFGDSAGQPNGICIKA